MKDQEWNFGIESQIEWFNDNNDLLSSFKREENFFLDPFPHIIIENCLPEKIYNQIEANYPDLNTLDYLVKKTGKLSSLKFGSIW
mgnify:CR=1 FL=1